jgi:hypothetical protein
VWLHLGILILGGGQGGKVVRVGRQSMQEMDDLENEEIYMFIYRRECSTAHKSTVGWQCSRPHRRCLVVDPGSGSSAP